MNTDDLELGERVIIGLEEENTGNVYHRQMVISDRWFDGTLEIADEIARKTREMLNGK